MFILIADLPPVPRVGATDLTGQSRGQVGPSNQCWGSALSAIRHRPASLMMIRVNILVRPLFNLSLPANLRRAEKSFSKFGHEIDKIMIKRNLKRKSNNLPQLWNSRKVVEKLFKRRQIMKYITV